MSSIEMRRISRSFGDVSPALADVDLDIPSGERLAVLGPSGSGKSTLLRIVAGLEHPSEGRLSFNGQDVLNVPPHRRDVGMVFQNPTLHPHLDVQANLEFGLKARGTPRAERRRRVGEIAALLRLEGLLKRRSSTLSGGERQRAAIGRAVSRRPSILLLDEPFSSLDLPLRSSLRRDLLDLYDRFRWTLIHVTHDQSEALAIGDRIAVLDRGRLVQCDPPRQIYQQPATAFVAGFVGAPACNLIPCEVYLDAQTEECTVTSPVLHGSISKNVAESLNLAAGERRKVLAGIRPEELIHCEAGSPHPPHRGWLTLVAMVQRLEFQGDAVLAILACEDRRLIARIPVSAKLQEGETACFGLELEKIRWLPEL